jgi:hypothetical protein
MNESFHIWVFISQAFFDKMTTLLFFDATFQIVRVLFEVKVSWISFAKNL